MYKIYTDGSCEPNPGYGGWAYIILDEVTDSPLIWGKGYQQNTTNNRMELGAVINALANLSYLVKSKKVAPYNEVTICTDSQLTINCAVGNWKRKKNTDLWVIFDKILVDLHLLNVKKIEFKWVRGHSGNYYNEMVDKLADKDTTKATNPSIAAVLKKCEFQHQTSLEVDFTSK